MAPPTLALGEATHEHETFLLEEALDSEPFAHWSAHLRSFWGWYEEAPNYHPDPGDYPALREMIALGLSSAGYPDFAMDLHTVHSVEDLNARLFLQYTAESRLYPEVNSLLRTAHAGEDLKTHPLKPWILQLNSAMRLCPLYEGVAWRGVRMSENDITQYACGRMFEWASFVSATREREVAEEYRPNVLFEISPWGSHSLYGKRNAYDIAAHSIHPAEHEVLFPVACTFRVKSIERERHRTHIRIETVDQY